MLQVHRDIVCSKCQSVNEHEQITREKSNFETAMIIRCKLCGHEYEQSVISYWVGDIENKTPLDFKVTDWDAQTPETF